MDLMDLLGCPGQEVNGSMISKWVSYNLLTNGVFLGGEMEPTDPITFDPFTSCPTSSKYGPQLFGFCSPEILDLWKTHWTQARDFSKTDPLEPGAAKQTPQICCEVAVHMNALWSHASAGLVGLESNLWSKKGFFQLHKTRLCKTLCCFCVLNKGQVVSIQRSIFNVFFCEVTRCHSS